MTWTGILVEPGIFTLPALFLAVWIAFSFGGGQRPTATSWRVLLQAMSLLVPLAFGLWRGFDWPVWVLGALRGDATSITWQTIWTGFVLIILAAWLVRTGLTLSRQPGWSWAGTILLAYHAGAILNSIVRGGAPFTTLFGA